MRAYLDLLHAEAKNAGFHVGLAKHGGQWALRLLKPNGGGIINELPVTNLHKSLDAAADILTEWIKYDSKGAKK